MGILERMLKQKAIYWQKIGEDDYGRPTFAKYRLINCRWEDAHEEFLNTEGTKEISQSVVNVDRDLKVGDILLLGQFNNVSDVTDPRNDPNAFEVGLFEKTPNLKATKFLRTAYLKPASLGAGKRNL